MLEASEALEKVNGMNEWMKMYRFQCVRKPTDTPCKQIQPLSRIKTLNGQRIYGVSPVGEEKICDGNDLPES